MRFWAKVESGGAPSVYALVGGAARGTVALTADGAWHEYLLSFGSSWSGQELMLLGSASGTARFLLDDVGLTLPLPPPVPTTVPASTGYYETTVTVDWVGRVFPFVFDAAQGPAYWYVVAETGQTPPPDGILGMQRTTVAELVAALDVLGATPDNAFVDPRDTLFRHRVSTRVWVPGPPPVPVPPVPQYRDWGVRILMFSATTFGVDATFGSPPASLFVSFTSEGRKMSIVGCRFVVDSCVFILLGRGWG